jgi:hypothetical protein
MLRDEYKKIRHENGVEKSTPDVAKVKRTYNRTKKSSGCD